MSNQIEGFVKGVKGQKCKPLSWYLLLARILFLYIFACYYGMDYINHSR